MVRRRFARRVGKYAVRNAWRLPGAAGKIGAVANLGYGAYRAYKSYSKRAGTYNGSNGGYNFTTRDYDTAVQYRRKRMPRRKRRAWVRFVKKTRAVEMKDQPTRSVLINNVQLATFDYQALGSRAQQYNAVCLYSLRGSLGFRDVGQIMDTLYPAGRDKTAWIHFSSATLDCTVVYNFFRDPSDATNVGPTICEVDVYDIVCRRTGYQLEGGNMDSPGSEIADAEGEVGNGIKLTDHGATPFQLTALFTGDHGWKILGKRKFTLQEGGSFTFQKRDPRNRKMSQGMFPTINGNIVWKYPGFTRMFLVVGRVSLNSTNNISSNTYAVLKMDAIRTYTLKDALDNKFNATADKIPA